VNLRNEKMEEFTKTFENYFTLTGKRRAEASSSDSPTLLRRIQNVVSKDKKGSKLTMVFKQFEQAMSLIAHGINSNNEALKLRRQIPVEIAGRVLSIFRSSSLITEQKVPIDILHSDLIDSITKGLIPAFYSLASARYLYTPKGDNIIPGLNVGGNKVLNRLTDLIGKVKYDLENSSKHYKDYLTLSLKTLEEIREELENSATGQRTYYTTHSPLEFITEHLENQIDKCSRLREILKNEEESRQKQQVLDAEKSATQLIL